MKRRTVVGLAAGVAATLAAGAGAMALGTHSGGRPAIMRRMVAAALDEALDQVQVTAEQRAAIHAARDRVFAVVDAERAGRGGHLDAALRLFEADAPDPALVSALHERADAARQRVRTAIHEAVMDVHGILTPAQRKGLADYVRSHRWGHLH
jgi:Spy/CpxP family protein refolding chaperone